MTTFEGLLLGFQTALTLHNLFYCFVGVFLGTLVGVLPGVGSMTAISLLLPLVFHLDPTASVIMLAGIFYGSQYGGSTCSILLNLPGQPSSAITCIDGHPMAQQGRAGAALVLVAVASFIGAMVGWLLLLAVAPALTDMALSFGPADYFSIMLLALVAAAVMSSEDSVKNIAMIVVGMILAMGGIDIGSGTPRFDLGPNLTDGINIIILCMGLFGVTEVMTRMFDDHHRHVHDDKGQTWPTRDDWQRLWPSSLRGSAIGCFFGTLPGTGASVATLSSYMLEKEITDDPKRFGQGAVEGVAAPEASNNASSATDFVPMLTLGVPGDAVTAMILSAFMIHGITPGPMLVTQQPELFWGLIASFVVGNVMLLILNIPMIGLWIRLLKIPARVLYPMVIVLISLGAYSINNEVFDILLTLFFGVVGLLLKMLRFQTVPLLLGFVLASPMEQYLRRAMAISDGDLMVFVERPISVTVLAMTAMFLIWSVWKKRSS